MNQIIFTDLGLIVAFADKLSQAQMQEIGKIVGDWAKGVNKVLILPLANWEILDKRSGVPA